MLIIYKKNLIFYFQFLFFSFSYFHYKLLSVYYLRLYDLLLNHMVYNCINVLFTELKTILFIFKNINVFKHLLQGFMNLVNYYCFITSNYIYCCFCIIFISSKYLLFLSDFYINSCFTIYIRPAVMKHIS